MQQDAQKLTEKGHFKEAIESHLSSISLIDNLIQSTDNVSIKDPLIVMKEQIQDRISDLQVVQSRPVITTKLMENTQSLPSSQSEDVTNVKLLNYMLNEIKVSFLKNVNLNIDNTPKQKTYKIPYIDKDKISHLEHSLQLITIGGGLTDKDYRLKNEYLSQLNSLYYTELRSCQDCLSDIMGILKEDSNPTQLQSSEPQDEVIGELQRRVNSLEREKIQMEVQIVKLKERWNGLVESARKRKESQSRTTKTTD